MWHALMGMQTLLQREVWVMAKKWISTADQLPDDGDAVNFLIDRHRVWMSGTYRYGYFESHWGTYDAGTVKHWSPLKVANQKLSKQAQSA